ncbi:hypothetical protein [Aliidiomarina sp. B3213]|nr:hypothetical protein [Aliidiomarina sp. B3213]RTE85614.1 hypothetical protein DQX04_12005 [Aliidiomarina sp. B3213]
MATSRVSSPIYRGVLLYTCFALLLSPVVYAQQLAFETTSTESGTSFHYVWEDQYERQHEISFTLDKEQKNFAANNLRHLSPARLQRDIVRPLQSYARSRDWFQMHISYDSSREHVTFNPNIRNEEESSRRIRLMHAQAQQEIDNILSENYLTRISMPPNISGYIPDHVRIARESEEAVAPLATAFYQYLGGATPRQYIEVISSFVQSIPYNELSNRMESNGAGFQSPVNVLLSNQGDCDSKVTLLASILRNLMPNLEMAIVYLPQHAVFAVAISPENHETTIRNSGAELLIMEPTGPALLKLGEPAPFSLIYLANGSIALRYFTPRNL